MYLDASNQEIKYTRSSLQLRGIGRSAVSKDHSSEQILIKMYRSNTFIFSSNPYLAHGMVWEELLALDRTTLQRYIGRPRSVVALAYRLVDCRTKPIPLIS
jgi:hypothetical protein